MGQGHWNRSLHCVNYIICHYSRLRPEWKDFRRPRSGDFAFCANGRLASTNQLHLAIGLPLRNQTDLAKFLKDLYDPTSSHFHRYLSPGRFAEKYGPSAEDYEKVTSFARSRGFIITGTHAGRMVVEATATVAEIENAFQIRMSVYPHPTEKRTFYAPENEPSVPVDVPILDMTGLDNLNESRPLISKVTSIEKGADAPVPEGYGSGPQGTYTSPDLRGAYAPDVPMEGSGQRVALLEFDACYPGDVSHYERVTGLPHVPLATVLVNGATGQPGPDNGEPALDAELAIAMASGLSEIILYEAPPLVSSYVSVLMRMADDDSAQQLSSSWNPPSGPNQTVDQIFRQMAAQGQSFFQASGDDGAYTNGVKQSAGNPNVTIVGGTSLDYDSYWGYGSESVWSGSSSNASGGGVSTIYSIPSWQMGIDMSANGGSTKWRNAPDVAMIAGGVFACIDNGKEATVEGTSVASPLWAAFTALANQEAEFYGVPPVGFLNPALYTIGKSPTYYSYFHDVTAGDNTTIRSPSRYYATAGYDLCTGWGSPNGQALIDALISDFLSPSLSVTAGLTFSGPVGGPFGTSQALTMTNEGWNGLAWQIGRVPDWLNVSTLGGYLDPGAQITLSFGLSGLATNLGAGDYMATLYITSSIDPTPQPLNIEAQITNVGFGALEVNIGPSNAVQEGAQWSVDGGPWQTSGKIIAGLNAGSHTVTFTGVTNWAPPPATTVTVAANQTNIFALNYTEESGSLTVLLRPEQFVGGALWSVDGGPWTNSGATISGLTPTNHTVSYSTLTGWVAPSNMAVVITGAQTNTVVAAYNEAYQFSLIAGQSGKSGSADGAASKSLFSSPQGIAAGSSGSLFVADTSNHVIREITLQGGNWVVSTIAGLAGKSGYVDGTNSAARFSSPVGVAADSNGNVYVTDYGNSAIRELAPSGTNWIVSTIYNAIPSPQGIAVDGSGNFWSTGVVAYVLLYSSTNSNGAWDTRQEAGFGDDLFGVAPGIAVLPNGLLYTVFNNTVMHMIPSPSDWGGGAGVAGASAAGFADGDASVALFSSPQGITADAAGNVYVADTGNDIIRKMAPVGSNYGATVPDYTVATIGGLPGVAGTNDGANSHALFKHPAGVAVDASGNLFIADTGNNTIRVGTGYLRQLDVLVSPADTNLQSMQFQVDGGEACTYGTTVLVTPGAHTISFQQSPYWICPSNITITVESNQPFALATNVVVTASYTQLFGSIEVTLGPAIALEAGAAWQLDGGIWESSGARLLGIPYGQHTLSFSTVDWWQSPSDYTFSMAAASNSFQFVFETNDATAPKGSILSPKPNQTWTNQTITISGVASDNEIVAAVYYQINGSGWNLAIGTNAWSSAPIFLPPGEYKAEAYAVDPSGNVSRTVTNKFVNSPRAPLSLAVNGSGKIVPNLNGQTLIVGKSYTISAVPGANCVLEDWNGTFSSSNATLTFTMETNTILEADFAPSPYGPFAGVYEGLFLNSHNAGLPSSGFFSATLMSNGNFTAKIQIAGSTFPISGRFPASGIVSNVISHPLGPITVQFSLQEADGSIRGQISTPVWSAALIAPRTGFPTGDTAPQAGVYTLRLPGNPTSTGSPGGDGFGTVTVNPEGKVVFSGELGDGTVISQSALLGTNGLWPFYASLYSGQGAIFGWMGFSNMPESDISGSFAWVKWPAAGGALYPYGFSLTNLAEGSAFAFTNGTPLLNFSQGQVMLEGGGIKSAFTNLIILGVNNTIRNLSPNSLSLTISSKSGVFHGTAKDPASHRSIPFAGALLQKQNAGYGLFLGTSESGRVSMGPLP